MRKLILPVFLMTLFLLISCKDNTLRKEKHWFNVSFDLACLHYINSDSAKSSLEDFLLHVREQAKDYKELARAEDLMLFVGEYIDGLEPEYMKRVRFGMKTAPPLEIDDARRSLEGFNAMKKDFYVYLTNNKEELKKKAWKEYLIHRKFLRNE
jgi:hypothetical protein